MLISIYTVISTVQKMYKDSKYMYQTAERNVIRSKFSILNIVFPHYLKEERS